MKQQDKLVPELRFGGFEGEWRVRQLLDLSENGFSNGAFNNPEKVGSGYKIINVKDMYVDGTINTDILTKVALEEKEFFKNRVEYGDIFFTRSSLVKEGIAHSNVNLTDSEDLTFDGHLIRMRPKKRDNSPVFLYYNFATSKVREQFIQRGKTTTMTTIGQDDIASVAITLPTLPEQQKIAAFLTAVDARIQALKQQKALLETYKKGVMQQLFSRELRFKDEDGREFEAWEEKRLGEVANRVTTKNKENNKNVLTISAQNGLVSQLDFFSKSVSGRDLSGYYLLTNGDFAYNKSYSNGYPMGAIKQLHLYEKGLVSTLYICFRFKNEVSKSFFEQYFESGFHNVELEKVAQEGARNHGLLNIGVEDFFNTLLLLPSLPEQTRIANFLTALDEKIKAAQTQITLTEQWKKGLLQRMFV